MHIYLIVLLLIFNCRSEAASVTYEVSHIAGNQWKYDYLVTNNTLPYDIEEFTIYFSLGDYENLVVLDTPISWDSLVAQPDSALPADGFYDALRLAVGISPGNSLSGFSVLFDYLLPGTPGSQYFEIIDPIAFDVLESGNTEQPSGGTVPEPWDLSLFAVGLWLLRTNRFLRKKESDLGC